MSAVERAQIDAAAWQWVIRMDGSALDDAGDAELQAWLGADRRHPGALLQAEAMWMALGDASQDAEATPDAEAQEVEHTRSRWLTRRGMLGSGFAAMAASIAGGLFVLSRPVQFATSVGEIRSVPLADGSTAAINTASRIAVALSDKRREIRLESGEVWFNVAKDKARPFVVEAGAVRVQAVGTAFSVRRYGNGADIIVTEGVVEAWAEGAEGNKIRLVAGSRAFIANNAGVVKPETTMASIDRTLAWRGGKVDFVDEPIADAIAEFNRYNHRQLVLADPAIGRERFDGVFRTDDPESFARAVSDGLGVPMNLGDPATIQIGHPR